MTKRIFGFIAILSLVSGVAFAYDADGNPNTKREIAGSPAWSPYREYRLVRFPENAPNSTALTAGDVVVADCVSDDGVTVNLVSAASSADAVMGVVVSTTIPTADVVGTTVNTDYGRRNWGYIQVSGFCTNVNMVGTAPAGGQSLKASDTARNADVAVNTLNGLPTGRVMGFAYDASTNAEVGISL